MKINSTAKYSCVLNHNLRKMVLQS